MHFSTYEIWMHATVDSTLKNALKEMPPAAPWNKYFAHINNLNGIALFKPDGKMKIVL